MEGFNLKIITLDGVAFEDEALSILVRTTVGDVCILKNHADYVGTIDVGKVKIKLKDGSEKEAACVGGFISVSKNTVSLVATTFEFAENIDLKRAELAKEKAERRIEQKKSESDMKIAELKLKKAVLRISVSNCKK